MTELVERPGGSEEAASSFLRGEERILADIAGDSNFSFKRGKQWGIDPETGKGTYDTKFFEDKGYTRAQALFAAFHEIKCHFIETAELLSTEDGQKEYEYWKKRALSTGRVKTWENIRTDIKGNKAILRFAPVLAEQTRTLYTDKLVPVTDFTKEPLHIQFMDAILRQSMVPDEPVKVSPEVEEAINKLRNTKGKDVIELATDPDQDAALALKLSRAYIEPVIDELYKKDLENRKNQKKDKGKKDKSDQDQSSKQQDQDKSDNQDQDNGQNQDQDQTQEGEEESQGDQQNQDGEDEDKNSKPKDGEKQQGEEDEDGEEVFKEEYKKREEDHPQEMEKGIEEKIKKRNEATDPSKRADEAYEKEYGVSKKDIDEYLRAFKEIEPCINNLREVFRRIVQERQILKRRLGSLKEEGVMLDPGLVAQTYMDVRAGKENPKTMKDFEGFLVPEDLPSEFSLHLVADQSGSMGEGGKSRQQRLSAILIMEALREFSELAEAEQQGLIEGLNIQTELRSFGVSEGTRVYKPLSKELSEKQRIEYFKGLLDTYGGTNDYDVLAEIAKETKSKIKKDSTYKDKLKSGKLREIVIVLTDGESGNSNKVQDNLDVLRDMGVKVVGVGMTEEAEAVLDTYEPDAKVSNNISELPSVLGGLLEEFLADFSVLDTLNMLKSE